MRKIDHDANVARMDAGITRANEMVIGASFAIMESSTEGQRAQASYMQSLFSAARDVLSAERRSMFPPEGAPDAWESFETSRTALALADALVGERR